MRFTKRFSMGGARGAGARALAAAFASLTALAVLALGTPAPAGELSGKVNVNTATQEELEMLPGIGAARARAVIDARKQRGGFQRVEDLLEVKGIGEASLEQLRPFVTLQGKTTARAATGK